MELAKIDTVGTFRWEVLGTAFATTKSSEGKSGGKPQAVLDLKATEKWVDDPEGMKHFGISEPAWVDWSTFNEGLLAYLLLFNSADEFSADTAMKNYEQLVLALGWDGLEFESFASGAFDGKRLLGRTAPNEYNGKTSIQLAWVDKFDANPERSLKSLDTTEIKALSARIRMGKAPAPAPARPPAKAAATSPAKAAAPAAPTKAPPPKLSAATGAPPAVAPTKAATAPKFPSEASQAEAWDQLMSVKGEKSDDQVADAWIAAGSAQTKPSEDFTPADWATLRDAAIAKLAA